MNIKLLKSEKDWITFAEKYKLQVNSYFDRPLFYPSLCLLSHDDSGFYNVEFLDIHDDNVEEFVNCAHYASKINKEEDKKELAIYLVDNEECIRDLAKKRIEYLNKLEAGEIVADSANGILNKLIKSQKGI